MTLESQRPIRVLLVEHDPEDLDGLRSAVAEVRGEKVEIEWVSELAAALERLTRAAGLTPYSSTSCCPTPRAW